MPRFGELAQPISPEHESKKTPRDRIQERAFEIVQKELGEVSKKDLTSAFDQLYQEQLDLFTARVQTAKNQEEIADTEKEFAKKIAANMMGKTLEEEMREAA